MRATLGLDVSQFESKAQSASRTVRQVSDAMARAFDVAKQAATGGARSFEELRASIDPAFAASQKYAAIQRELAGMVGSGAASQRAANIVLEQAAAKYMGVETAAERTARAQREAASAVDEATRGYTALRSQLDPLFAASNRYEQAQETLAAAVKAGVVSQEQANRVLAQAGEQYLGATQAAATGASKIGPAFQNASYQVGDFAVQIAAGTSATQALAMQLPQLLGGFGMWGAAAGAAVAIVGALAPVLFGTGNSADEASGKVDDLSSAVARLSDVSQTTAADLKTYLGSAFGAVSGQVQALIDDLRAAEFEVISQKVRREVEAATAEFQRLSGAFDVYWAEFENPGSVDNGYLAELQKIISASGMAYDESLKLDGALKAIYRAKDADQFVFALARAKAIAEDIGGPVGQKVAAALLQAAKDGGVLNRVLAAASGATDAAAGSASNLAVQIANAQNAAVGLRIAMGEATSAIQSMGADIGNKIAMLEARNAALRAGTSEAIAGEVRALELRRAEIAKQLSVGGATLDQIAKETAGITGQIDAYRALSTENEALQEARQAAERASGSGARAATAEANALDKSAQKYLEMIDPMEKFSRKKAELKNLLDAGKISADQYRQALAQIAAEMGEDNPVFDEFRSAVGGAVDYMLDGFKGGFSGLFDIAKSTLKQIISMFLTNRITLSLGVGVGGGMAGAAGAAVAGAGGMGALGSLGGIASGVGAIFGKAGSALGAFGTGAWGALSNLATGGLSGSLSYISTSLSYATSGLAGFATAAGAILGPLAAVAAAVSFFRTKTTLLDAGIRVTVDEMDALVYTFKKVEKSRFGGLSKSTNTSYDFASAEVADPLRRAVAGIQTGIMAAADALDIGAGAFEDFTYDMKISTKGLSDDEIAAKVQEEMAKLGDAFAAMIPGLDALTKEGETATAALDRLQASLTTVNGIMDTLGHSFEAVGLAGAGVASDIADAFGGLEAMAQATSAYYESFYSEAERLDTLTRQTTEALADLGMVMPATRAQYRALIEAQDLTTERGREVYAALISMAGAMDQVLPSVGNLTAAMSGMVTGVVANVDDVIGRVTEISRAAAQSAKAWRTISDNLRDFVAQARRTASELITPGAALAQARRQYGAAVSATRRGDQAAGGTVAGLAGDYIAAARSTAATALDAARVQARVLAEVSALSDLTGAQATYEERIVSLAERQLGVLGELRDYLTSGVELDPRQISRFQRQLASIADRSIASPIEGLGSDLAVQLDGLTSPMGTLRTALDDLRDAIREQQRRAERSERVNALSTYAGGLATNAAGDILATDAQIMQMAQRAGIDTQGMSIGQVMRAVENFSGTDAIDNIRRLPGGIRAYLWDVFRRRQGDVPLDKADYLRLYPDVAADPIGGANPEIHYRNYGRREILSGLGRPFKPEAFDWSALGLDIPGFAAGGMHSGGLRLVGEAGPELEVTGPSRIYSASQTRDLLSNRETVAELRAMREELARMRSENTQLALRIEANTYTSASIARREERRALSET